MSDSELEPAIDWSKDDNVLALGRKTDEDVLAKGWCDEKSAGMFLAENLLFDEELTLVTAFDSYRRKSTAYNHFNATIVRAARQGDVGTFFQYHYVCKFGRTSCKITQRRGTPTDKLLGLMKTCDLKHNINGELLPSQLQPPLIQTRYDPVHHRMLVAMRCVASNRPFLSTEDHFYKLELQHIHPGESFSFSFQIFCHSLPRKAVGINTDIF